MKTLKELAEQALAVQDACNLSGVLNSFREAMSHLWEHAHQPGRGTDWVVPTSDHTGLC